MAKLFLSYAREDAGVAKRIARALERGGEHDVWWDRDLQGGASFGSEIEQQLKDCDLVVVLWSKASVQSPWVRDEAAIGRDAQKLIPVAIEEVEPPIGFRQIHTIDLHGRIGAAGISKLEQAIQHAAGRTHSPGPPVAEPRRRWAWPAAAAILLAAGAGAAIYWSRSKAPDAVTVTIIPGSGHAAVNAEYANAIAADLTGFLSAHGESASVLDPGDPQARNATYRFNVDYSGEGKRAEPSLTMAARGQQGMVWSRSWSVDDPDAVDLKKQMSFAAARALMCALEAKGSGGLLDPSLLKLYVVACSGLYGDDAPHEQLAANYSQIVAQRPRFAPAWQNLAVVRSIIFQEAAEEEGTASPSLRNAALEAIARARQLTPKSGKVLLAEANLASDDWSRQLPLLDRAIALEPDQAMFYVSRSYALQSVGRMRDAIADSEKAVQLDPLSPIPAVARINALMYGGRLTRAKEEIANAYKIWPDYPYLASADLGYSMRYGDPRRGEQLLGKALSSLTDDDKSPARSVLAAREDPTPAKIKAALDIWRGAMALHPNATTHYLLTLGTFGKFDDAFRLALDPKAKSFVVVQSFFRPDFAPMRRDRRFMAVAEQYGLVRYWRSSGKWPDFCSDEPIDYDCKTEAAKYS